MYTSTFGAVQRQFPGCAPISKRIKIMLKVGRYSVMVNGLKELGFINEELRDTVCDSTWDDIDIN